MIPPSLSSPKFTKPCSETQGTPLTVSPYKMRGKVIHFLYPMVPSTLHQRQIQGQRGRITLQQAQTRSCMSSLGAPLGLGHCPSNSVPSDNYGHFHGLVLLPAHHTFPRKTSHASGISNILAFHCHLDFTFRTFMHSSEAPCKDLTLLYLVWPQHYLEPWCKSTNLSHLYHTCLQNLHFMEDASEVCCQLMR